MLEELHIEVDERVKLIVEQQGTTKRYLVERVREEDWPSVLVAANQLQAMAQELESLSCVSERLKDAYYE